LSCGSLAVAGGHCFSIDCYGSVFTAPWIPGHPDVTAENAVFSRFSFDGLSIGLLNSFRETWPAIALLPRMVRALLPSMLWPAVSYLPGQRHETGITHICPVHNS